MFSVIYIIYQRRLMYSIKVLKMYAISMHACFELYMPLISCMPL